MATPEVTGKANTYLRPRKPLKAYDDRDTRKEFVLLLDRLPPHLRVRWLNWCCRQAKNHAYREFRPKVKEETFALAEKARWDSSCDQRLTQEVYRDVFYVHEQWDLDLDLALARLVEVARRYGRKPRGSG